MRIDINFSSREYILVRQVQLVMLLIAAVLVYLFVQGYLEYRGAAATARQLGAQIKSAEERHAELGGRLEQVRKSVSPSDVESAVRQADFANAAIRRRVFSWTAFLNHMEEVVPQGVEITNVKPSFSTLDVDIAGSALGMDQLTEFVQRLSESKYFEDIPPVFQTNQVEVDKYPTRTVQVFNLRTRYNPEGVFDAAGEGSGEEP